MDFDQALVPHKAMEDPQGEARQGTTEHLLRAWEWFVDWCGWQWQSGTLGGFAVHGMYVYVYI